MNFILILAIGSLLIDWGASKTVGNRSQPGRLICQPDQVPCDNHYRCVGIRELCNGVDDCRDNSDENLLTCIKMGTKAAESSCKDDEFLCDNGCNMCIPKRYLCDGDNDCGDYSDEKPENCIKEGQYDDHITCTDIGFNCPHPNGTCISKATLCNGVNECADNSDENITNCILMGQVKEVLTCSSDEFKCKNGFKCVRKHLMCNSFNNCYDGSDEDPVECTKEGILPENTTCADLGFECSSTSFGGSFCIGNLFVCDGKNDCGDNSDESPGICHHRTHEPKFHLLPWYDPPPPNTTVVRQCGNNQFRCLVGRIKINANESGTYLEKVYNDSCIPNRYVCDLEKDCEDGIDEDPATCQNRTLNIGCKSHQFKCSESNKCIPKSHICDGDNDCGSSDENPAMCQNITINLGCTSREFKCSENNKCIPTRYVCDGDNDCGNSTDVDNGTDEDPAMCRNITTNLGCTSHQFKCSENDKCIPKSFICDGDNDCGISTDEDHNICHLKEISLVVPTTVIPAYTSRPVVCKKSQFRCKNGLKCTKREYICDGDNDCGDDSDEDPEVCGQKMM